MNPKVPHTVPTSRFDQEGATLPSSFVEEPVLNLPDCLPEFPKDLLGVLLGPVVVGPIREVSDLTDAFHTYFENRWAVEAPPLNG